MLPILKLTALLALLATEGWLLWNPTGWQLHWDALAGFFSALLGLLLLEREEHKRAASSEHGASPRISRTDVDQFHSILKTLDPKNVIHFLRHHDFGATFLRQDIQPLYDFVRNCENPDQEFVHQELERDRKVLVDSAKSLAATVANKTVPIDAENISVLPRELINKPRPDWVNQDAKEINEASNRFVGVYDDFVRKTRSYIAS